MRPLRKVPVVMTTAPAKTLRPSRSLRPMTFAALAAVCRRISKTSTTSACLMKRSGLRLEHLAHLHAILLLVALRARRPDGGAARGVEQAELDADGVGDLAHDSAERVDFAHQMALGDAADGGVAGHLRDEVEISVKSAVRRPMRAAAMAASQPACPAPTTTTSYCSVYAIAALLF